jgi:hypothetical protein
MLATAVLGRHPRTRWPALRDREQERAGSLHPDGPAALAAQLPNHRNFRAVTRLCRIGYSLHTSDVFAVFLKWEGRGIRSRAGEGIVGEQPPSWDPYGQQDPTQYQGQPPYQGQPYPGPPYPGQPYQGQPYQGQPYQGQPYQGQPYQGQPYQGQPYQGQPHQGQPYQGQPYGPQGGPAPYPGSGYGQGPQPPPRRRRRKRHLVRNSLAGIGAVVVAIIVISALASHGSGVSTTPSGSSSTAASTSSPGATPKVARVGSYFDVQDASGNTYRVTLVKVIDPARGADQFNTPDPGKRFVGVVFTIKALSGSPQDEDANNDAAVVGGNGQTYNADIDRITGYTNFSDGQINVAQGDTTTGAVVFQVPDGIKVTSVQWSAASGFGSTVQWDVRSARTPKATQSAADACDNRPDASGDIYVRMITPGVPAQAQELGGEWRWDSATSKCLTSVQLMIATAPQTAGNCTQVGYVADNPEYDPNATPAKPLENIVAQTGPAC